MIWLVLGRAEGCRGKLVSVKNCCQHKYGFSGEATALDPSVASKRMG